MFTDITLYYDKKHCAATQLFNRFLAKLTFVLEGGLNDTMCTIQNLRWLFQSFTLYWRTICLINMSRVQIFYGFLKHEQCIVLLESDRGYTLCLVWHMFAAVEAFFFHSTITSRKLPLLISVLLKKCDVVFFEYISYVSTYTISQNSNFTI